MSHSLFISDLHLCPDNDNLTRLFLDFIENKAVNAENLYILGDFFDYWLGDDCMDAWSQGIAEALRRLADCGTQVFLMGGNRDFFLGPDFAKAAACTLLDDPHTVKLYGRKLLLKHGDDLCTLDKSHQWFRRVSRHPWVRAAFLGLPKGIRLPLVEKIRKKSESGKVRKSQRVMDVVALAVQEHCTSADCDALIHGHIHRASHELIEVDGRTTQHWVLADWRSQASYLELDERGQWCSSSDSGRLKGALERCGAKS